MRRLDHSMIFLLIAGTYTPFALLVLDGALAHGDPDRGLERGDSSASLLKLLWLDTPKWLTAAVYVALGWVAVAAFPTMLDELGVTGTGPGSPGRRQPSGKAATATQPSTT